MKLTIALEGEDTRGGQLQVEGTYEGDAAGVVDVLQLLGAGLVGTVPALPGGGPHPAPPVQTLPAPRSKKPGPKPGRKASLRPAAATQSREGKIQCPDCREWVKPQGMGPHRRKHKAASGGGYAEDRLARLSALSRGPGHRVAGRAAVRQLRAPVLRVAA